MELDELDVVAASDKGADLTLLHPATGKAGDAVLTLRGYDSDIVVNAGRENDKSFMGKDKVDLNDTIAARRVAMAKASIIKVKGLTLSGQKIDVDQLRSLLERPGLCWIVDQITDFGSKRTHFFPKPQRT